MSTCRRMTLDPHQTPHMSINTNYPHVLNVRAKTTNLLIKNVGEKLHDLDWAMISWI